MKSFVDTLGWFRWANSSGWSTADIEAIVNQVALSFSPQAIQRANPSRKFRRGIRTISIRESSGSGIMVTGGKYRESGDSVHKYVVGAASWSDATINILKQDRWYDSAVQALATVTDKGHAPPHVVREFASSVYDVIREIMPGTEFEMHRGGRSFDPNTLKLSRKINKLEAGEVEVNPTLRLRSYRQAYVGGTQASKTYRALYSMMYRAERFERNAVGLTLTEHEMNVLKEAQDICDGLVRKLHDLSEQHINSLKNVN